MISHSSPAFQLGLEVVLQSQLKKAWIRRVLTKKSISGDLTTDAACGRVGRRSPGGRVEQIEDVCAELQVLLAMRREILGHGHVDSFIPGPGHL